MICADCRFFEADPGVIQKTKMGTCRYNPAIGIPIPYQIAGQTQVKMDGGFAAVRGDWWCGKWQSKVNGVNLENLA